MTNGELEKLRAECRAIAERYDVHMPNELWKNIVMGDAPEHPA